MAGSPVFRTSSASQRRSPGFTLFATVCVVAATGVNLGLYALGRAIGAALRIDPGLGEPDQSIVVGDVAWKTAVPLVLGAFTLGLIARHSHRWASIVTIAGFLVVLVSIPFVLAGAHDLPTGFLLAAMHTTAGLAYVSIGVRTHRGRRTGTGV